jgi:phage terminase large subunit
LKGYKLNVTQRSSNLRKELNSYKWEQNRDGVLLNKPVDFMNHAIDALRYVALNKLKKQQEGKYTFI